MDNLVEGSVRLMATDDTVTGPINIGNPHEIAVRDLAKRVIQLAGSRSGIVHRELPQDDPTQRCPDIGLARRALGWEPKVPLEVGLGGTIGYFRRMLSDDAARATRLVSKLANA